jgi:cell division septal protein FtsQ
MSRRSGALRRGLPPAIGVPAQGDRRFRRPDIRPSGGSRHRGLRRTAGFVALAVLMSGALAYGAHVILLSRWFTVRHLVVHGTNRLTTSDVEARVSDLRHDNILLADLGRYQRQLGDSPWIAEVTLHRELPSTVVIDITERVPMVFAHLGDRLYLVDAAGTIIDENSPQYRDLDLPVVDGLGSPGTPPGSSVDAWRVKLVERFLSAIAAAPALRSKVSQIDVSDSHDITVLLEGDSTVVRVGDEHFVDRLERYQALAPTLREKLSDLDYVDVRFDNLFVRPRGRLSTSARPVRTP